MATSTTLPVGGVPGGGLPSDYAHHADVHLPVVPETTVGYLAEYVTVDGILHAAEAVRDAGYSRWDTHSPFPVHGMDAAMGIRSTILPWITLTMGVIGFFSAILLQWYVNAYDYKYIVSGKPYFSLPANVPVIFEMTVLFSAFTTVFGMFLLCRLPRLYSPLFKYERFRRATSDRFFVAIDAVDPKFDEVRTLALLEKTRPVSIVRIED